jgi:hypothetical protein
MMPLLAIMAACAGTPAPGSAAVPKDAAVIVNSGSTNTLPYRIVLSPDRHAIVTIGDEKRPQATLSQKAAQAFFKDLQAAMPLSKLPHQPCMKSASFGSTTYIEYKGERSPDLSCGAEGAGAKLAADVQRITTELKVVVIGHGRMFVPQSGASPAPTPSPEPKPY